jgi:8-oxo-dGTP pyrophosphatase MutT (NUDIX family)
MKRKNEVSAGGIVYKKKNNNTYWLITQHSKHKGWSFPKGLIGDNDKDEPKEKAALREVEEEGGIKAKIVNPQPVNVHYMYKFEDTLVEKTVYYFLMEYQSGDPENHDWEVSEAKFVTADEIKKTLTFKTDKEAFEKILQLFGAGEGN